MTKSNIRPHPLQIAKHEVRLPSGAFLRALPFTVDRATRLRLDAIVFAADVLASAYVQMVEVALAAGADADGAEDASTRQFQCAWTIVDQIHNIRLLLDKLERKIPEAEQFRADFEVARELRNRMDHLNAHIPNIANSPKPGDSLFGSISYVINLENESGGYQKFFVLRQTGAVQPGQKMAELKVPTELRLPVGNFQLEAIGRTLDVDQAVTDLGRVMITLNDEVEGAIMAQIKAKAAELNRPETDLLAHYGASITIALAFDTAVEELITEE